MTDDIIERLRERKAMWQEAIMVMEEAAAEIERLQTIEKLFQTRSDEINRLWSMQDTVSDCKLLHKELLAEIERLKADKKALAYQVDHFVAELGRSEAEIERLRALVKETWPNLNAHEKRAGDP